MHTFRSDVRLRNNNVKALQILTRQILELLYRHGTSSLVEVGRYRANVLWNPMYDLAATACTYFDSNE